MALGLVYVWEPSEGEVTGGRVNAAMAPLLYLDPPSPVRSELCGRYVEVVNLGRINETDDDGSIFTSVAIGNASSDTDGNFIVAPALGGGRLDKSSPPNPIDKEQFIEASHFGEVNTYYHVTRIAERVDELLRQLGEKPLPRVCACVNAHAVAGEGIHWRKAVPDEDGVKWRPIRGAHYRFRKSPQSPDETFDEMLPSGEILLGQGMWSTREGWLPRIAGAAYTCNASHIAGYIYQAYGHHITRHTADFQANALKTPYRQNNLKSATDTAVSRYWAASMLGTPHIECWHRRHDRAFIHPSSLDSGTGTPQTAGAIVAGSRYGDTGLAAALWDLRQRLLPNGKDVSDLLVLAALLEVGRLHDDPYRPKISETRNLRNGSDVFAAAILHADATRFDSQYSASIRGAMEGQGIEPCRETLESLSPPTVPFLPVTMVLSSEARESIAKVQARVPDTIIPADDELLHPDDLEALLRGIRKDPYDLVTVGDVMTGGRMRHRLNNHGPDYPFAWVKPVFRRAAVVIGNLEAPFARKAAKQIDGRNFHYKVDPRSARTLRRSGINAMNLANNHILDCGRDGVRETLSALEDQTIMAIGAGLDEDSAHAPGIFRIRDGRIGILGYYWNTRTSARSELPGTARNYGKRVERDIERLKRKVDYVVVTVHWGIPYQREPSETQIADGHGFVDCGADIVVGHHPHIIQPFEIYRGRPIFYSVGNFAFGSANSRAESLLLGVGFSDGKIEVDVFPTYVVNRDLRVDYQPKLMRGDAARRALGRLAAISDDSGENLVIDEFVGRLQVATSNS